MKLNYTYKIIKVDKSARAMEIVYESEKYGKLHVGTRLPYVGETLEDIVLMYNPTRYWAEQDIETIDVEENIQGQQEVDLPVPNVDDNTQATISIEENVDIVKVQRQFAYQAESDPIFFKAQRGEATLEEWTNKVEEIKLRFPYPEANE